MPLSLFGCELISSCFQGIRLLVEVPQIFLTLSLRSRLRAPLSCPVTLTSLACVCGSMASVPLLMVVPKPHVRELELGDTFCAPAATEMSIKAASESQKKKIDLVLPHWKEG